MIKIPREKISVRQSRSGGAGGQGVNRTESKVEIRFHVESAEWLNEYIKARFLILNAHRINQYGEFVMSCDEQRSRHQNLEICFQKLQSLISAAAKKPKVRRATQATRSSQRKRVESKKIHGQTKSLRKKVSGDS